MDRVAKTFVEFVAGLMIVSVQVWVAVGHAETAGIYDVLTLSGGLLKQPVGGPFDDRLLAGGEEIIYNGGTLDQLIMPAFMDTERIFRRIATFVGTGRRSSWKWRHYSGMTGSLDSTAPALRQGITEKVPDEGELSAAWLRGLRYLDGRSIRFGVESEGNMAEDGSGDPVSRGRGRSSAEEP